MFRVLVTDHGFQHVDQERSIIESAGGTLLVAQCRTEADVIRAADSVDGLLVQWAPITVRVLQQLRRCRIIVRYGVGVDNIAVAEATRRGITVCNVPDYCADEVADHTVALALALARQLPAMDRRLRAGTWQIVPDAEMPACRDMLFASAGYGRIGRAVLARASGFGFRLGTHDPYADRATIEQNGVIPLSLDELFARADVLTLHLPLTRDTRHFVDAAHLQRMKSTAVLVNTSRGELVDTRALAHALMNGVIASAGIDVFEEEPPPPDHPLLQCENALLTSHMAWYSEQSLLTLQRLAADEIVRGLRGEPLRHSLNRPHGRLPRSMRG